jgi:hypothetical protein
VIELTQGGSNISQHDDWRNNDFIKEIEATIQKIKADPEEEARYMEYVRKEECADAHDEGYVEGKTEAKVFALKKLMKKLDLSAEKAMDILDVPIDDRQKYAAMLQG